MQFSVPLSTPGSVQISQVTETLTDTTPFCEDVSVPASATALQLYFAYVSGASLETVNARVIGLQSGTGYTDGYAAVPNPGLVVPVNTAIDTSFEVCWEVTTEPPATPVTVTFTIAALLSMVGAGPATVNVTCNCEGGGGGMLAYGLYTSDGSLSGTQLEWTAVSEVGAVMLQGDGVTFDFPAGSVVLADLSAALDLAPGTNTGISDTATEVMVTGATTDASNLADLLVPMSASWAFAQSVTPSTQFEMNPPPDATTSITLRLAAFAAP